MFALVLVAFFVGGGFAKIDKDMYNVLVPFRECFNSKHPGVCLKERSLTALDITMKSTKPFKLIDGVEVERNPTYYFNFANTSLPADASARSMQLTDSLHEKLEEYFKSRVFKFVMSDNSGEEGRKKKNKGGGMMMMAMGGMACMVAQLFMGKIAFIAGTALVLAKIAFFMSAMIGLKKMGGGGGSKEHVVYASEGHGGGWHRSLVNADAQNIAYKAHISDANGY